MQIQVFADVACARCWVGHRRLERAAAAVALSTGTPVEVRLRAYRCDEPDDEAGRQRLTTEAARDGIGLRLDDVVPADSTDALRLLSWAWSQGGPAQQRDLAVELWRAYAAEGADLASHATLAARAGLVGLDLDLVDTVLADGTGAEEVRLQLDAAASLGIEQCPAFVVDSTWMLQGVQRQQALEAALGELVASTGGTGAGAPDGPADDR